MSIKQILVCDGCAAEGGLSDVGWVKILMRVPAGAFNFTKDERWDYCSERCFEGARVRGGLMVVPAEPSTIKAIGAAS